MTDHIRNFSIIAHIDHGKSTLADRFLQFCRTISERDMKEQVLDDMDLERERGITIKARAVRLDYPSPDGRVYQLNLIDTPGHVDFAFEVSRSLAACEGVLLLVDASQGIQAQTLANMHLARERNLMILGVINKIDLPNADPEGCRLQFQQQIGLPETMIHIASGKTGAGVPEILESIVRHIPPPSPGTDDTVQALIFDSTYDNYRGVIAYLRIFSGTILNKDVITLMHSKRSFEVTELGIFQPQPVKQPRLACGEVGYLAANMRDPRQVQVGDTITLSRSPAVHPIQPLKRFKPVVFSGVYPLDPAYYEDLKRALEKLQLNDSSLTVEAETSVALGFGFRVGFLGLLHMEIIQERIDREYGVGIIMTAPSVIYRVMDAKGCIHSVDNPAAFPDPAGIVGVDEPYVRARLILPGHCLGGVMHLCLEKRGIQESTESLVMDRLLLTYLLPLAEIITDFYDKLKSITQGYGSIDYEEYGLRPTEVVKLDILLNAEPVDAFSTIVHRSKAEIVGRNLISRLKDVIPRHLFSIPLQAAVGQKIIARETIKALRKNVTAKCYGGDITRKKKLLEKQKEGKRRMKLIGKVQVPKNAFVEVLKND